MVRDYDAGMGELTETLERFGVSDNTILVITTDHGEPFPRAKGELYDPGIGTARIIRWPAGGWSGGKRHRELLSNVDILPTLLEACGIQVPDTVQGKSSVNLLSGGLYAKRDAVFSQKTLHDTYDPMRSIRTERYKLIWHFEWLGNDSFFAIPGDIVHCPSVAENEPSRMRRPSVAELYDLYEDPNETRKLFDDPAYSKIRSDLQRRLTAWMNEVDDPILRRPVETPFFRCSIAEFVSQSKIET